MEAIKMSTEGTVDKERKVEGEGEDSATTLSHAHSKPMVNNETSNIYIYPDPQTKSKAAPLSGSRVGGRGGKCSYPRFSLVINAMTALSIASMVNKQSPFGALETKRKQAPLGLNSHETKAAPR